MQDILLVLLQGLMHMFQVWDSAVDLVLGPSGFEWRFGSIVPPTGFDAVSYTTALLWLYRNVASEIVLLSFVLCAATIVFSMLALTIVLVHVGWRWFHHLGESGDVPESRTPGLRKKRRNGSGTVVSKRVITSRRRDSRMNEEQRRLLMRAIQQALVDEEASEEGISAITPLTASRDVSTIEEMEG